MLDASVLSDVACLCSCGLSYLYLLFSVCCCCVGNMLNSVNICSVLCEFISSQRSISVNHDILLYCKYTQYVLRKERFIWMKIMSIGFLSLLCLWTLSYCICSDVEFIFRRVEKCVCSICCVKGHWPLCWFLYCELECPVVLAVFRATDCQNSVLVNIHRIDT